MLGSFSRALTAILTAVYEEECHDFSYGFRAGRGCHEALRALARHIGRGRVNWVVEADVKGFFDNVDHDCLLKMVAVRVRDERVLGDTWLRGQPDQHPRGRRRVPGRPRQALRTHPMTTDTRDPALLVLTKPGQLRSIAAYPRRSADLMEEGT